MYFSITSHAQTSLSWHQQVWLLLAAAPQKQEGLRVCREAQRTRQEGADFTALMLQSLECFRFIVDA